MSTTCSLGLKGLRPDQLRAAFAFAKGKITETSTPESHWSGSGVVIAGGGKYLSWTLNNVRNCRRSWNGPIQVWCLNSREIPDVGVFSALGVEVVNAQDVLGRFPMRKFGGWHCKMYAVLHSPFQRVLFLDADCFATRAGVDLLNNSALDHGEVFFGDVKRCHQSDLPYFSASLVPPRIMKPPQAEFETGAFLVDKARCHAAVRLAVWCSEHSDSWWSLGHGDKLTTEIAFRALKVPHRLGCSTWNNWGICHEFHGKFCFAHMLGVKRGKAPLPDLTVAV